MWPGATDEESNRKAVQDRKGIKSKVRIYDTFPIRNFDHWIEESKSHLWVVGIGGDRKSVSLFGSSKAAARAGFGGDALAAVWAPDGQSVVFAATEDDTVSARANVLSQLWQVPATGGEPKRLTPDGGILAARRSVLMARLFVLPRPAPGRSSISSRVSAAPHGHPRRRGTVTIVNKDFDRSVSSWSFAPDNQTIYVSAEDAGHERIYAVPVSAARRSSSSMPRKMSTPTSGGGARRV